MGFDMTGANEFAAVLTVAADEVVRELEKVVGKGCGNVKREAQRIIRDASSRGYLPHYPRSISYDVTRSGDTVTGVVGPDAAMLQGGLARILEYGTVNSAPIPHISPAFDAEVPRLIRAAGDVAVDLLNGAQPHG